MKSKPCENEIRIMENCAEKLLAHTTFSASPLNKMSKLTTSLDTQYDEQGKLILTLQNTLDTLRVFIKYVLFDLEATQRENKYLRDFLESEGYQEEGQEHG